MLLGISIVGAGAALVLGAAGAMAAGAASGVAIGGKELGNELAAFMGGFYGPLAGVPGVVIALVVLAVIA